MLVQEAISQKNDEMTQLKLSIKELRNQLENLKFEKQKAVQEANKMLLQKLKILKTQHPF